MLLNMLVALQREMDTIRDEKPVELETQVKLLEQRAWDEAEIAQAPVEKANFSN